MRAILLGELPAHIDQATAVHARRPVLQRRACPASLKPGAVRIVADEDETFALHRGQQPVDLTACHPNVRLASLATVGRVHG